RVHTRSCGFRGDSGFPWWEWVLLQNPMPVELGASARYADPCRRRCEQRSVPPRAVLPGPAKSDRSACGVERTELLTERGRFAAPGTPDTVAPRRAASP